MREVRSKLLDSIHSRLYVYRKKTRHSLWCYYCETLRSLFVCTTLKLLQTLKTANHIVFIGVFKVIPSKSQISNVQCAVSFFQDKLLKPMEFV